MERHTLMSVIILGVSTSFSLTGLSQAQFMRWGSVASLPQSYLVMVLGVTGVIGLWSLINYSGLVVYSVYADCDPLSAGYIDKVDQVLMYFVVDKLGYLSGIPGLFVAAIYSGVLSSVSSTINALSAMVWKDLLEPMSIFAKVSEKTAKNINIIISACTGVVAVGVGVLAGSMGSLVQVVYALGGAFGGPITGIFITALLCPWVKQLSVFLASTIALAFNMWLVMGNFLYAPAPVMLPLSVDGCLDPSFNSTTVAFTSTDVTTNTLVSSTSMYPGCRDDDVFPLYKLSYGLYGAIGTLITIVLATLLSCFVGFESSVNVPASSVNTTCLRFYCWLRHEEKLTYIPGASSPTLNHPEDVKSIIISDSSKCGSAKLHKEPEVMTGCDNPMPVGDYL